MGLVYDSVVLEVSTGLNFGYTSLGQIDWDNSKRRRLRSISAALFSSSIPYPLPDEWVIEFLVTFSGQYVSGSNVDILTPLPPDVGAFATDLTVVNLSKNLPAVGGLDLGDFNRVNMRLSFQYVDPTLLYGSQVWVTFCHEAY